MQYVLRLLKQTRIIRTQGRKQKNLNYVSIFSIGRVLCVVAFFEHRECYLKNLTTRDFGRPQNLSRFCDCVGEPTVLILPFYSQSKQKNPSINTGSFVLAGVAGFEPTNAAVKVLCLTA